MKAWTVALSGTLALSSSSGAWAVSAGEDGNGMLLACKALIGVVEGHPKATSGSIEMGRCVGTVGGVKATMMITNPVLPPEMKTCFPDEGINDGQGVRIVIKYLNDHPEQLNIDRNILVIRALHAAYPCK